MSAEMTCEEWVQRALEAVVEQGFPLGIEDPVVIEMLASVVVDRTPNELTPTTN